VFLVVFVPLAILMTAGCKTLLRGESNSWLAYFVGPFFALFPALMASSPSYDSALVKAHGLAGTIVGLLFFIPFFAFLTLCGILRFHLLGQRLTSRTAVSTRPIRPVQYPTVGVFVKETGEFRMLPNEPEQN